MIYLQVKGGLGNQLFQYSTGYFLSKQRNMELCLDYSRLAMERRLKNTGIKKEYSFREVQLEHFNLDAHRVNSSMFDFFADRLIQKIVPGKGCADRRIVPLIIDSSVDGRVSSNEIKDDLQNHEDAPNVILSGYWQDYRHIEPIKESLQNQFKLNITITDSVERYTEAIQACQSVGVHVRRGDYVRLGLDKGKEFYIKAMSILKEKITNARFFVFSDDQSWVKENLLCDQFDITPVIVKEEYADIKEFDLLMKCRHQIITDSTFGWWAAFLNNNEHKIVVAPREAKGNIWMPEWIKL